MPSKAFDSYLRQFDDFRQLPDEPDSAYRAGARNRAMEKPPPGCSIEVWESYLREKWGTTDPMPESFDPERLEKKRQEQLPSQGEGRALNVDKTLPKIAKGDEQALAKDDQRNERMTPGSRDPYSIPFPAYSNGGGDSVVSTVSATESPDKLEKAAGSKGVAIPAEPPAGPSFYQRLRANAVGTDARAAEVRAEDVAGAEPESEMTEIERRPTPRIRAGSKPPLSKSAYANSCSDADCGAGARRRSSARPPKYFPFRSQMGKSK